MSKNQTLVANLTLALTVILALSACEPKNEPRWEHEGQRNFKTTITPDQEDVKASAFNSFDQNKAYAQLKDGKGGLTELILKPLSEIVLNRKFIESPLYHSARLSEMIAIFNAAFVQEFAKKPRSAAFGQIKEAYYNTVFAGCTRDLRRDCTNAGLFSKDGRHTMIMTLLARELDVDIEIQLKTSGSSIKCITESATCRSLVEERYRRLAMGVYKANRFQDPEFAFAYLKFARLFSTFLDNAKSQVPATNNTNDSMSLGYIADVHGKIFETILSKYVPKDINDPEFKAFVENFNPWGYSRKQADLFQYGTGKMFELGAKCCLYEDAAKTKLNKSVRDAINESQVDKDSFGLTFRQIIEDIKKDHGDRIFTKLRLGDLIKEIENPNSGFYNEYFFIVDRLFRGHLSSSEIDMMLRNTNPQRARTELPRMISNYMKVYLVYMVVETNRFMGTVYHSNIASDKVFEEAIVRSRELTARWYTVQAQIDLLDKLMNSYFKDLIITSQEYNATFNMLKAVNRNIHYLSAYPNMIVMNYFLSKMKGTISFNTWWGKVEINADTVLKAFFDGNITSPWFRFGKDTENLDRLMLLYSLEYLLSTEGLDSFVAKDSSATVDGVTERSKFFELIFSKYIGDTIDDMRKELSDYQRTTVGNPSFAFAKEVCGYEMNNTRGLSPRILLNFMDLGNYTYTGLGNNSLNRVFADFLTGSTSSVAKLLDQVDMRRTYVRAMIDVIEGDLLRTGQIKNAGDAHPDLAKARQLLKELDEIQSNVTQTFVADHKMYFNCAMKLREVERRRANRLYDEEREHLGKIYDVMKPLAEINDSQVLNAKVQEINDSYFVAANGFKFDRLDGMNYRLSKYDLFMRMKKRIEGDIFVNPTDKERRNYGGDINGFLKSRAVSVSIPEAIVRDDMYAKGISIAISFSGTSADAREDFIRQGLAALNGKTGSFISWQAQMETDKSFMQYLTGLEAFYLLKPVSAQDPQVSADDLTSAFLSIISSFSMDAYDVEYAKVFANYGHYSKDFYQGILFEKDGMTRLPLFYSLMNDVVKMASIDLDKPGSVQEALEFAKQSNSMQAFVFKPSEVVQISIKKLYGDRAHYRLNRVSELFSYLARKDASVKESTGLDVRLAQPIYLENGILYMWNQSGNKNLIDTQRFQDLKFLISNFAQRSGNFYGTREKVNAP